jgi:hypothetical protein
MNRLQKYPQLANVIFLGEVGETLRQATSAIAQEELPAEIRSLLQKLERVEKWRKALNGRSNSGGAAP